MPRRPRIHLDGMPLHLVQRGHNRQPCFFAEADYWAYLNWLGEAARKAGCKIHAYALMTNHVHLLLTPADAQSVPRMMVALGRQYVPYINAAYQRSGTLWEGRYRATVVEAETYLFECMRYIELNPVRADMVAHPAAYPWSSYRANAEGKADALLTPHLLYRRLGANGGERQAAYGEMVKAPLDTTQLAVARESSHKGWALGGGRFQAKIERLTQRRTMPLPKRKSQISG